MKTKYNIDVNINFELDLKKHVNCDDWSQDDIEYYVKGSVYKMFDMLQSEQAIQTQRAIVTHQEHWDKVKHHFLFSAEVAEKIMENKKVKFT